MCKGERREGEKWRERERGGNRRRGRKREGGGRRREMANLYNVILSHTALPPTIGYDTSNGSDLFLREGESIQLCVVLLSGSIPFEFTFEVEIRRSFEQPRGRKINGCYCNLC